MSVVIGVRIPKELKEELTRLGINYSEEVRRFLEERVKIEKRRRAFRRIMKLREEIGRVEGNRAVEFVREDRER